MGPNTVLVVPVMDPQPTLVKRMISASGSLVISSRDSKAKGVAIAQADPISAPSS